MTGPAASNFLPCRPMYREGQVARIQNALIFPGETAGTFGPAAPRACLTPRQAAGEDGSKIPGRRTSTDPPGKFSGPGTI